MKEVITNHGHSGYVDGCRCDICKRAASEYGRWYRTQKRKNPDALKRTPAKHGTTAKYVSGCRCVLCKQAQSEYNRQYREGKNRERLLAQKRQWSKDNIERRREWRNQNRDHVNAQKRAWWVKHRDRLIAEARERYWRQDPDQRRATRREYYLQNREYLIAAQKEYAAQNRERLLEYYRDWYDRNRDNQLEYARAHYDQNRERIQACAREYYETGGHIVAKRRRDSVKENLLVTRTGSYSPEEDAMVMVEDLSQLEIAIILGRSRSSVSTRRWKLRRREEVMTHGA